MVPMLPPWGADDFLGRRNKSSSGRGGGGGGRSVEIKSIYWTVPDYRIDAATSSRYKDERGYEWWLLSGPRSEGRMAVFLFTNTPYEKRIYCWVKFCPLNSEGNEIIAYAQENYAPNNTTKGSVFGTVMHGDYIKEATGGSGEYSVPVFCQIWLGDRKNW
eukprot:GHVO01023655.1.p1 GENE.GHVO01023655.1~~GHVO01023655.1.p1  ORF type:complete len:160 (-),score=8.20 GHVO01023655.1:348-827(-)